METDLSELKGIICELQRDIEHKKRMRDQIPIIEPGSYENTNQISRCWIHGGTNSLEAAELEQWHFDNPPLSEMAQESASNCVKCWRETLERKDNYYWDFEDFEFEDPHEGEILHDYLVRMARLVESEGKGERLEWRALKSFLNYLRQIPHKASQAFVEQIFPKKMDLFNCKIIRKIPPEVYPISVNLTAEILIELANMTLHSRSDAQLAAAESLGLSWLCLTASRIRLPIHLETMIYPVRFSAVSLRGEFPQLLVPTLFGDRPIRISVTFAKYFDALSRIPSIQPRESILQKPFRAITRTFERALERVALDPKLGNITYLTFLSAPHEFGDHIR